MKFYSKITTFLLLIIAFSPLVMASRSEKVRMIKVDPQEYDLIVEKQNGERWLIQYNRSCSSMSTEFPLDIIYNDKGRNQLKVAFNEICDIYYMAPYSGEGEITELIQSKNLLIKDHEAKIKWKNAEHSIDYEGQDCNQLYQYINKRVYITVDPSDNSKGYVVMPGNVGQCPIKFKNSQQIEIDPSDEKLSISGLDYQAQNNQVYLYWDPDTTQEKPLYVLAYSKFELNTDDYSHWREMPKSRIIRNHSYTVRRLANDQNYHFYISVLDENGNAGDWTHIELTPQAPKREKLVIEGEEEKFEVKLEENDDYFRIFWPSDQYARRYFLRFYVDGKEEFFDIEKPEVTEWKIPKEESYLGKGLRFTVRTLPIRPFYPTQKDGIFWEYKE